MRSHRLALVSLLKEAHTRRLVSSTAPQRSTEGSNNSNRTVSRRSISSQVSTARHLSRATVSSSTLTASRPEAPTVEVINSRRHHRARTRDTISTARTAVTARLSSSTGSSHIRRRLSKGIRRIRRIRHRAVLMEGHMEGSKGTTAGSRRNSRIRILGGNEVA